MRGDLAQEAATVSLVEPEEGHAVTRVASVPKPFAAVMPTSGKTPKMITKTTSAGRSKVVVDAHMEPQECHSEPMERCEKVRMPGRRHTHSPRSGAAQA
eukprot:8900967-Pyramimonas_sp.AAC.1